MTAEMRKERAKLYMDLTNLLTDCKTDAQYFRRMTWALEFISNNISRFDIEMNEDCDILVIGDQPDNDPSPNTLEPNP